MLLGARQFFERRGAGGELPAGYAQVEYVYPQSEGAYIDLGWYPTKWTAFDAYMTIAPYRKANFGVTDDASAHQPQGFSLIDVWANDRWLGFKQNGTNEWNEGWKNFSGYTEIRNSIHHHVINLSAYMTRNPSPPYNAFEYSIDGNIITTGYWSDATPNTKQTYSPIERNVYLFAANVNGTPTAAGVSKIGVLKFFDADGVCANFIPCLNPQGAAGMFDTVSKSFHGASSGTILYQPLS